MITIELQQGSPEWHQFRATKFTASDAPAMLGLSKYKTRSQLLQEKATGLTEEVDGFKQALFDKGHAAEASARPIIEKLVKMDLFPVTGVCEEEGLDFLAASFDGLTMCESIAWEHKLWNEDLADCVSEDRDLPDTHWPQVEHQLIVSGANYCLFTVSDGTEKNMTSLEYTSVPERRKAVIDGWLQFAADLSTFEPEQKAEKLSADVIRDLPALTFDFNRTDLTIKSNLSVYKEAANDLVEKSKKPLESDQDFANAESMIKFFKSAEDKLAAVAESVVGQVADIDRFVKDLKEISESIRAARLNTDKQVKSRKEQIKLDIVQSAQKELADFVLQLEHDAGYPLPRTSANFAEAIKGKKTVQSLKEAAADELAKAKIEANNYAAVIKRNVEIYQQHSKGLTFLFNDFANICLKAHDDFLLLVQSRVNDYEKQQADLKAQQEADELARKQAEENKPAPAVQTVAEEVKAQPDAIGEAKTALTGKVGNMFAAVEPTLSLALDSWCNDYAITDEGKAHLFAILNSFGVEV